MLVAAVVVVKALHILMLAMVVQVVVDMVLLEAQLLHYLQNLV